MINYKMVGAVSSDLEGALCRGQVGAISSGQVGAVCAEFPPIHIHAEKGDMECKFWLLVDQVEIKEAFAYNMTPAATRELKKIIYQHFDLIVDSWNNYFKK